MVTNTNKRFTLAEAIDLRNEASVLLDRLTCDCEASKQRLAEAGKRDPMKCVTGRSSFEEAIAATREMIHQMDELVAELQSESDCVVEVEMSHRCGVLVSAR